MMAFLSFAYFCALAALHLHTVASSSRLPGIPTIPFTPSNEVGTYPVTAIRSVIIDSKYENSVDTTGETLIPQTLRAFAGVFASDTREVWGLQNLSTPVSSMPDVDSVFLTISDTPLYHYESGELSAEGFVLEVTPLGITIRGASPLGVWWGTRSLIQLAILSKGNLPYGTSMDSPGWKTRGMMLDAARKFYPSQFVADVCAYMSYFKQNTLHLHLSDNLYNNAKIYSREQSLSLYARFRLWSDAPEVAGLNNFKNESYKEVEFHGLQLACAARGVTIIPEIEAPGHALPIVQWKPELGLSTDLSLLNISHPDTIPTMKTIWRTFFDWFDSKTVHIGADEYTGEVSEYNRFVNEMAQFIRDEGNKSVRIWGTFPPKPEYDNNIDTNVSIQHWEFFEDNPLYDYIENDYSVVNSDDTFYIVSKWSESYPQKINVTKTFHGDPASGGPWRPHIFDTKNSTNNPARSNKAVLGAVAPLWNDFGPNATVCGETYYAWREGIPALADKQWGGTLLTEEFVDVFPALHAGMPHNFLERRIESETPVIVRYDRTSWANAEDPNGDGVWKILNVSGNDSYDALTNCTRTPDDTLRVADACALNNGLSSMARDYALTLRLRVDEGGQGQGEGGGDATLLTGIDSTLAPVALMLTPTVTLLADGTHFRLNATVPAGAWVDLSIVGRGARTFASVQRVRPDDPFREAADVPGRQEEEFLAVLGVNGERLVWAPVAIEVPTMEITADGWSGEFAGMILSSRT
ncbi:putative glycoside hydrolase [Rosellinia necatrix]|uniref:beta-N-acetylhexosaminidase n=1 Tax=Rosellinia necatrix TaxID=77044 RepID=A0A1W2TMZ7_ROSNE|nr:putative glycoside hydrolase [Rosellinia necatrix]